MISLPKKKTDSSLLFVKPTRTLDEVLIDDETRKSLMRLARERSKITLLAQNNIKPRNRLLFHGPPGNGKTATAEALANLYNLPLYIANYAEMTNCYVGESEKAVVAMFREIKDEACILFFDEADSVMSSRVSARHSADHSRNSCTNLILTNLDRLSAKTVFIAATNRLDDLDDALDRRFDAKFEFPNPTTDEKRGFVKILRKRYRAVDKVLNSNKDPRKKGLTSRITAAVESSPSFAVLEKHIIDFAREIILGE